ncbi:MAG TPA: hypothetical protein VJR89_04940 [Polyangiales bacterium]|nr:hypothetical protein [Polyangiales bacterium]
MPTRLAVIGDSLAQGFQDGAIGSGFPQRSFPAVVARSLGLEVGSGPGASFRVPAIPGDGLPLDIVALLAGVAARTGPDINLLEWPVKALPEIARYFDELEGYYEVGPGSRPSEPTPPFHNLAAYGLTVFESLKLTSSQCDELIEDSEGWFRDDILGTPSGAKWRAAKMILDPDGTRPDATQLDNLEALVQGNDAPNALIVWLGANDALATVVELELRDMAGDPTPDLSLEGRRAYNLTSAQQFRADYLELASRIDSILAGRDIPVFVGTVPDVSIPPIAKGLGELRDDVFDFYVRFFVRDGAAPPPFHKRLRRGEVEVIQQRIASFNDTVRDVVSPRPNWHLVDIAGVLQQLAVRRNHKQPEEPLRDYYVLKGRPDHPLLGLQPTPSLLTLRTDESGKRTAGGLTSLDGVHPTTIGYGIAAEVFLEQMQASGIPGANPLSIDWARLISEDRLATQAPSTWDDFLESAEDHSLVWDTLFRTLSSRV